MKLYFKYLSAQLKTNFAYRGSSLMSIFGQMLNTVAAFFGIYLLFLRFGSVGGYPFEVIMLTFGVVAVSFYFAEMMFRGFDEFSNLVRTGQLDTLLLRPRNIVLQILGSKIETMKLGRVVFGLVVLIIACIIAPVQWTALKVLVLLEMLIAGVFMFFGIYLLTSAVTIFTIRTPEAVNVLTYGARDLCNYPLDVYKKGVRKFFTFILPYATFNYIPLRYLLYGADAGWFCAVYPWFSVMFAALMYVVFNLSLKGYKSAG